MTSRNVLCEYEVERRNVYKVANKWQGQVTDSMMISNQGVPSYSSPLKVPSPFMSDLVWQDTGSSQVHGGRLYVSSQTACTLTTLMKWLPPLSSPGQGSSHGHGSSHIMRMKRTIFSDISLRLTGYPNHFYEITWVTNGKIGITNTHLVKKHIMKIETFDDIKNVLS